MYPWNDSNFQWNHTPEIPNDLSSGCIQTSWKWNSCHGDGINWNFLGYSNIFYVSSENEWQDLIFYNPSKQPLSKLWKPIDSEQIWWYFSILKLCYDWATHSRKVTSILHIKDISRFQQSLYCFYRKCNGIPQDPYGNTIWHSIWGSLLGSVNNIDEFRMEAHEITGYKFTTETMMIPNCYGQTWLHCAAQNILNQKIWERIIKRAYCLYGLPNQRNANYTRDIWNQTCWDILEQRSKTTPWIRQWIDTQITSPVSIL